MKIWHDTSIQSSVTSELELQLFPEIHYRHRTGTTRIRINNIRVFGWWRHFDTLHFVHFTLCIKDESFYVGETRRSVRLRYNEHIRNEKTKQENRYSLRSPPNQTPWCMSQQNQCFYPNFTCLQRRSRPEDLGINLQSRSKTDPQHTNLLVASDSQPIPESDYAAIPPPYSKLSSFCNAFQC